MIDVIDLESDKVKFDYTKKSIGDLENKKLANKFRIKDLEKLEAQFESLDKLNLKQVDMKEFSSLRDQRKKLEKDLNYAKAEKNSLMIN